MKPLDEGYSVDIDKIEKDAWHGLMALFDDASFYQTWSYGRLAWGEKSLSHLVLTKDQKTVALVQLRIARLPLPRAGMAYAVSGPMWKRKGDPLNLKNLQNMIRPLCKEYAVRRGDLLQILPRTVSDDEADIRNLFKDEGYSWTPDTLQTISVDLSPSPDELEKNMRRKWRQTLHRAQKQDITIEEGSYAEAYDATRRIIEEMKERKRYVESGDMKNMIAVHQDLPEALRLKIFFCKHEGNPVAVLGWFPVGTTGLPLIAATGNRGLELNASYPLFWKMIEYYKQNGFLRCDLGGVNEEKNPGGYLFKAGLAGETCEARRYIGQFEACENTVSSIAFKTGLSLRSTFRNARTKSNALLNQIRRAFSGRRP